MSDVTPDDERRLLRELLIEKYEPVAIVGAGLRFPGGSRNPDELADFLRGGRSGVGPIPDDRWDVAALAAGDNPGPGRIKTGAGGFVDDLDRFDPKFFNISPKEARYVDPQQRMVLETAWEALEHAGIDPAAFRGGPGAVYIGAGCHDFGIEIQRLAPEELDAYLGTGTSHSAISGRLSHFLGWRGPSVTVDTACSASLVALHLATEGLRRRECDIALTGGVSAVHHPLNHIVFSQAGMLAPDGRCKTFDDKADGYGRSEGCGMVVLKRVSDALRDGDRIMALVRGVAVRQDGDSGGLTVPSGPAQEGVMRAALTAANLEPADIGFVEAHGTGTPLGDPIEMGSIRSVFGASRDAADPLLVSSFKTNVGHMEAAAGIGGLIKTALQFAEPDVYPHLNLDTPSRHIPWHSTPVLVPTSARPWPAGRRRAMVNSFGFAGTIASAVLEQAPPPRGARDAAVDGEPYVFALSGKDQPALRRQADRTRAYLAAHPGAPAGESCATSTLGRTALPARLAGVVRRPADIDALLTAYLDAEQPRETSRTPDPVAFLFAGQGSQYPGMGAALYRRFPAFRADVDACDELFAPLLGRSVATWLRDPETDAAELGRTHYTQPALFTLEYALARLWLSWGIRPSVLIGHSIGEVAAAAVAGVFTLPDAVRLVEARGRLMQSVGTPGGMLSVTLAAGELEPYLKGHDDLAIAARNAPGLCVLSGAEPALRSVAGELARDGVPTARLAVSHAFHSPLMAEVTEAFRAEIAGLTGREPELTVISTRTAAVADPAEITTADYWVRHIAEGVDFVAGMRAIEARGRHTFLEIGPAATLVGLGRKTVEHDGHTWLTSLHSQEDSAAAALASLAKLHVAGHSVAWPAVHDGAAPRRAALPTYAFERRRCWLPGGPGQRLTAAFATGHSAPATLLGAETTSVAGTREFTAWLSPAAPDYLADHRVAGRVVFPAAGFIELILAAQDAVFGETARAIGDLRIHEPLWLSAEEDTEVCTRVTPLPGGTAEVVIVSRTPGAGIERRHVDAVLADDRPGEPVPVTVPAVQAGSERTADELYLDFAEFGLAYGPRFRLLESVGRCAPDVAVGLIRMPPAAADSYLPVPVLDCVLQTVAGVADGETAYLPVSFERIRLLKKPRGERLTVVLHRRPNAEDGDGDGDGEGDLVADLTVLEDDRVVATIDGLTMRRLRNTSRRQLLHEPSWQRRSVRVAESQDRRVLAVHGPAGLGGDRLRVTAVATAAEAAAHLPGTVTDVCWFWRPATGLAGSPRLRAECETNYRDLLDLVAVLDDAGPDCRLWLITEAAQPVPGDAPRDPAELGAASLWGFGHTLWSERPRSRVRLVDLPPGGDLAQLRAELLGADDREYLIALRADGRRVRRIRPVTAERAGPRQLVIDTYGSFGGIVAVPAEDVPPAGDQIQVRVRAAGLNFKDVLNALGMLEQHARDTGRPSTPLPLGMECAGTVVAAGPLAEFAPGDDVVVGHLGCMTELLTVGSAAAVRKPSRLSFAQAAGVSTPYTSAWYALHDLAGLKAGDKVLIHAAAGGVGQAAVQLAKLAGAEIYATASPGKWGLLRSQGVRLLMNSRNTDFADEIMAATGGRGVDIVLNSLNKDYIAAGMRVVAEGGHFVELGKIGVLTAEQAVAVRPDVSYHNFDLSELPEEIAGPLIKRIMTTTVELLDAGAIQPAPTTEYGLDELEDAFGTLSRGVNIGKVVLRMRDEQQPPAAALTVGPDETYLITGGLGGLGLAAAEMLAGLGARHLALVGRRAVPAGEVARLRARFGPEVTVTAYAGDVSDAADVARILAAVQRGPAPLAGVVHAAGVLADSTAGAMTWSLMERVFAAKAWGALALHEAVAGLPGLRMFVGYSSVAAVFGPKGQANYAGANAYLDALMQARAAAGQPALAVGWGPWSRIGMAAGLSADHVRVIESGGQRFLRPADGTRALVGLLDRGLPQVLVGELDFSRLAAARPLDSALFDIVAGKPTAGAVTVDLAAILAVPRAERLAAVTAAVRALTTRALHYDHVDEISPDARFTELGLDSLVAVELKNALENAFRQRLATGIVFDHPTVAALARHIFEQLTTDESQTLAIRS